MMGIIPAAGIITIQQCFPPVDRYEEGKKAQRLEDAKKLEKQILPMIARAETVFVRDTVRLTRLVTQWDTVYKESTIHITDTVFVKAALATAATTIKACTITVEDCRALGLKKDTLIRSLRDQLANVPKPLSGFQTARRDALTGTAAIGGWELAKVVLRAIKR